MEEKTKKFTFWNWVIFVAAGILALFYLSGVLLQFGTMTSLYNLIIGALFLWGFITMMKKWKASK